MFKNFMAIAYMRTPIAAIDPIILDSIINAAKAKEILGDEFYAGANVYGDKQTIDDTLGPILDKQSGVYCTSAGIGENREFVGNWVKRWDSDNDDIVDFGSRGKVRTDIGSGQLKNYHMPIVLKSYKIITFYIRGDMEEIQRLLKDNIYYLGKKGSQGYGQISKWKFAEIEANWSAWKDDKPMRPIPISECENYIEKMMRQNQHIATRRYPTIPPYWRNDHIEPCIMPEV